MEWQEFFRQTDGLLSQLKDEAAFLAGADAFQAPLETLKKRNRALYEAVLPGQYEKSVCDPAFAVRAFGEDWGRLFSALMYELRGVIPLVYEKEEELFNEKVQLVSDFRALFEASDIPDPEAGRQLFRDYYLRNIGKARRYIFRRMIGEVKDDALHIVETADFSDPRYLFRYGEYITDSELETAAHLNSLSTADVQRLADVFTKGYQRGFALTGKDLSKKKTVAIYCTVGFERLLRAIVKGFREMGLETALFRVHPGMLFNANETLGGGIPGFAGDYANDQYHYDHKDDNALFLDEAVCEARIQSYREVYQASKDIARGYAGPAVLEIFGRALFAPEQKKEAVTLSDAQRAMVSSCKGKLRQLLNEFIPEEERSFTIMALPVPAIGARFKEIFDATVQINTLDVKRYEEIQATLINTLDASAYCRVKGMGRNRTDLTVTMQTIHDPAHETNFENCLADVNIPLGEVFTSPRLKGTNGTLHVSGVYLEGLFYKELELTFTDGMVTAYSCANFPDEAQNKRYIEENILFHHKTLPMGEFAIGTNTTAYAAARRLGFQDKLPILIAEKTGPHFAVGDTCYSYDEDIVTYNPDGKRITARENEISALRKTDPDKAYFSCHTDITLPYNELGLLSAVTAAGEETAIIRDGRFVLPGTEALNEALAGEG